MRSEEVDYGEKRLSQFFQLSTWVLVLAVLLIFVASVSTGDGANGTDKGRDIYDKYCAKCHGPEGKGDSESAERFDLAQSKERQILREKPGYRFIFSELKMNLFAF